MENTTENIMDVHEIESTMYLFMQFLWKEQKTKSYFQLNRVMHNAMLLALDAGLQFIENDVKNIYYSFFGERWFGTVNGKIGEEFYERAKTMDNETAIKSFEHFYSNL